MMDDKKEDNNKRPLNTEEEEQVSGGANYDFWYRGRDGGEPEGTDHPEFNPGK